MKTWCGTRLHASASYTSPDRTGGRASALIPVRPWPGADGEIASEIASEIVEARHDRRRAELQFEEVLLISDSARDRLVVSELVEKRTTMPSATSVTTRRSFGLADGARVQLDKRELRLDERHAHLRTPSRGA